MSPEPKIASSAVSLATIPVQLSRLAIGKITGNNSDVALHEVRRDRFMAVRDLSKWRIEDDVVTIRKQLFTFSANLHVLSTPIGTYSLKYRQSANG